LEVVHRRHEWQRQLIGDGDATVRLVFPPGQRAHPREAKKQQTKEIQQSNASLPASVAQTAL